MNSGATVAHIDSVNPFIQIPQFQFDKLITQIKNADTSIVWDDNNLASASCSSLVKKLANIEFSIDQDHSFILTPEAYLITPFYDQDSC